MYAFLCVLGAVADATGFALIASGVPINEFALGNTLIIAGTVSAIGGLIIIGLGLAVRELQRIERAMAVATDAARRSVRAKPAVAAAAGRCAVAAPPAPAPAPPRSRAFRSGRAHPVPDQARSAESSPQAGAERVSAAPAPAAAEEAAFERLRQKFPSLARIENAPVVEANEVSLSPKTPARTGGGCGRRQERACAGRERSRRAAPWPPYLEPPRGPRRRRSARAGPRCSMRSGRRIRAAASKPPRSRRPP